MTLDALSKALSLETVCAPEAPDREVGGVYVGDLLSRAMSRVKAADLWITIMTNRNVIAVAELTDACAVVLAEGAELLPEARDAALQNGIAVFSSPKTAYELCRDAARVLDTDR